MLLQYIDKDNLPEYLGGSSKATLLDDAGPWNDQGLIDEIDAELKRVGCDPHLPGSMLKVVGCTLGAHVLSTAADVAMAADASVLGRAASLWHQPASSAALSTAQLGAPLPRKGRSRKSKM